ncbi:glycosyltransferase [Microbacterium esteraromaticum]|nr:glycosyltransferase [Microbacterium esteraromaticum]
MRVAIVTESFLPHMNGVTGSVLQILTHLERNGYETQVLAPAAAGMPDAVHGAPVHALPSLPLPGYRDVRVATASGHRVENALRRFRPDVIHLASPFALGWHGALAADRLGIGAVAAYQTDISAYTQRYGVPLTTGAAVARIARLHRRATLNLAPSEESARQLQSWGVDRVRRWGRGVDAERFHPARRSIAMRAEWGAGVAIGYVGRLAPEKQVEDLAVLQDIPGARLIIIGDGPSRGRLQALMPNALFLGHLSGEALAAAMASLDVFVHPGESETFGQTLQEAHASGVPVVATGRGGPLDLVRAGIDGWLYTPGDVNDLRSRVGALVADAGRRRAYGAAGHDAVQSRSWASVCDTLIGYFDEARSLRRIDAASRVRRSIRPEPSAPPARHRPRRYVALGDSLTEGLCDPAPDGTLRGWADRLALLLAGSGELRYANLAVRSRRVRDVCGPQLDRAVELRPDLVSILIGANDLVGARPDTVALAAEVERAVRRLRETGADVLLVTPFLPRRWAASIFAHRFAQFSSELARVAERTGAVLLDSDLHPSLPERPNWGDDLVHLSSRGHRFLAYRAGELLGVPFADELGALDAVLHADEVLSRGLWWRRHALPWLWRRMRGRTAGDGLVAKHSGYVRVGRSAVSHDVHSR